MSLIPITAVCNQKCIFCAAHGRNDHPSLENTLSEIDARIRHGEKQIILSGGETTLCEDLFKIIRYIKRRGLAIEVQTNGLTSRNMKVAKVMTALGVDLFNINFPTHESGLNDRITGTAGTLPQRIQGVKNLLACGAEVRITNIILSINYEKLPEYVKFIAENFPGIKYIQFSYLKGLGAAMENSWLLPPYEKAEPYIIKALELCEKNSIEMIVDHIPPCFMGRFYKKNIDYIKTGAGADVSIPESEKAQLPGCEKCAIKDRCFGPRKEHLLMLPKGSVFIKPVLKKD